MYIVFIVCCLQAVLLEEDTLVLSGLRAVVSAEGEHGENMIREDEAGFTVMLRRPVRDLRKELPNIEVRPHACFRVGLESLFWKCLRTGRRLPARDRFSLLGSLYL